MTTSARAPASENEQRVLAQMPAVSGKRGKQFLVAGGRGRHQDRRLDSRITPCVQFIANARYRPEQRAFREPRIGQVFWHILGAIEVANGIVRVTCVRAWQNAMLENMLGDQIPAKPRRSTSCAISSVRCRRPGTAIRLTAGMFSGIAIKLPNTVMRPP